MMKLFETPKDLVRIVQKPEKLGQLPMKQVNQIMSVVEDDLSLE